LSIFLPPFARLEAKTPEKIFEGAPLEEILSKSFPGFYRYCFFCSDIHHSRLDFLSHLHKGSTEGLGRRQFIFIIFGQGIGPIAIDTKEKAK
jgi:hypothetical protein